MGKRKYFNLFLLVFLFMLINFLLVSYLHNKYLILISILLLSTILVFLISKRFSNGENSKTSDGTNGQSIDIRESLRGQVEISTKIYSICEELNGISQESLASAETIASSVETADVNTAEQYHMLNKTNELTDEVFLSLEDMENEIADKIQSISDSINAAQKGMEDINHIDERVALSRDMTEKSSKQVLQLKNYSDEIVGLIDLINSISRETNMLSLNASIEAARAGEHGQGFGVVAMEVGKLAKETEEVSVKIEETIYTLKEEIDLIAKNMEEDMKYADENCSIMASTQEELNTIIDSLNMGKVSLEEIKKNTRESNETIEKVAKNINEVASFSEEIAKDMAETASQVLEQYNSSKYLQEVVDKITDNIYNMQQFVAGKVMEEKMLESVYYIKDYVDNKGTIDSEDMKILLEETGMDDIYITNPEGVVIYTSNKDSIGLNLYEADASFKVLKEGKQNTIITPIKVRVEDGELFKFLTIIDENKCLYEVGLALNSLLKTI